MLRHPTFTIDHLAVAMLLLVSGLCTGVESADPPSQSPKRVAWDQVQSSRSAAAAKTVEPPSSGLREVSSEPQLSASTAAQPPRPFPSTSPSPAVQTPAVQIPVVQRPVVQPSIRQRPVMQRVDLHRHATPNHATLTPRPAPQAPRPAAVLRTAPSIVLAAAEEELLPHAIALPTVAVDENVHVSSHNGLLNITAPETPLSGLLSMIAEELDLNIVSGDIKDEKVTVMLHNVDLDDAFNAILAVKGYTWSRQKNIVMISSLEGDGTSTSAAKLGREVRVYNLNYVLADDIEAVVNGLLSPVGQAFTKHTSPTDQRQTHEQLVVEDLPNHLQRIESYLSQTDIPPRQVLVEAHVLQVSLKDEMRHGVDFNNMLRVAGSNVSLESPGFANDAGPTTVLRFKGGDLSGLLEAIKTTTDAKTLASPKVAVLNGQEARMQVGGQIGYLLTTTTQTSTLQSVDFLDVGVILSVTPIITDDHQVLLQVRPQVSTGNINATTQLPESETTEVDTTVMLADGEGLIIGGLIQEIDNDAQNKVPLLGNVKYFGRLFQKRKKVLERNEIIIALVPRILTGDPYCRELRPDKLDQATTPLLHGPLHQNDRRMWEPELPDASRNDLRLRRESRSYELDF